MYYSKTSFKPIGNYLQKRTVKLHPPIALCRMRTLVDRFRKIVRLLSTSVDSKTGHYISTVAHHASLSRHGTAMERTENATRAQITTSADTSAFRRIHCGGPFQFKISVSCVQIPIMASDYFVTVYMIASFYILCK